MKRIFGSILVLTAQQYKCTSCHWLVYLKMIKWQILCSVCFITIKNIYVCWLSIRHCSRKSCYIKAWFYFQLKFGKILIWFFKDCVYLFLERGERREREKETNICLPERHRLVASHKWSATGDLHSVGWHPTNRVTLVRTWKYFYWSQALNAKILSPDLRRVWDIAINMANIIF